MFEVVIAPQPMNTHRMQIICWRPAGIGFSTARTDCPRWAVEYDEAHAVYGRAMANQADNRC